MSKLYKCLMTSTKIGVFASLLLLAGCKTDLYSKLSESESNEIISVLAINGIPASRVTAKDGTTTVQIDEAVFGEAVAVLNDAGLPRQKFASMGDVFADTKLVSSPMEERARFIYASSQELSKTLSEIEGVFAARVHIVLPRNDPLQVDARPSSASVFIKHSPEVTMAHLLPQIKTLVTNGIEGLTYDKVSVVFVAADKTRKPSVLTTEKSGVYASTWRSLQDAPLMFVFAILGWIIAVACAAVLWTSKSPTHKTKTVGRSIPGLNNFTALIKNSSQPK